VEACAQDGIPYDFELPKMTAKGRRIWVRSIGEAVRDADGRIIRLQGAFQDITATKEAEALLRQSLQQQEVLLKEIHHRVKNNLAVISSLFYLESTYATDERAVKVFEESQRRVRSMALVHETLYGSGNLADIDFAEYARVLTAELLASYRLPDRRVELKTDLETMKMSIDLAVPCGLILNELISNAFKHAFANGRGGAIAVTLRHARDGMGVLRVTDDGVGVAADLNVDADGSLGLRLIRSLVRQIRGTFALVPRHPGTEALLTFALEEHA
jgi:two-component sensor histidine kinase